MADEEHLKILRQELAAWNEWREKNPELRPDLHGTNLAGACLFRMYVVYERLLASQAQRECLASAAPALVGRLEPVVAGVLGDPKAGQNALGAAQHGMAALDARTPPIGQLVRAPLPLAARPVGASRGAHDQLSIPHGE